MQDNTKRADRVLFWAKVIFILLIVLWVQYIFLVTSVYLFFGDLFAAFAGMFFIVLSFCIFGGIFISVITFCVSYLSWLHRAVTNLRLLTTTNFSPMGAVLLTCIPFVGLFLNYFIFSDLVKSLERCMQQRGILKNHFPKRILNAWFLAMLLLMVVVFVYPHQPGPMVVGFAPQDFSGVNVIELLEKTLIVIIPILYIMSFSAYAKQERELFQFHTEALFQKRVDEAIRERDIMRAAEMLRKNQNKENSQSENFQADRE